jgi:hypothetical protein
VNSDQAKSLVFITGATIAAISLLEYSQSFTKAASAGTNAKKSAKTVASGTETIVKEIWGISLAMIILYFVAEQIPEVAGPVALLILVAYLYKKEPVIKAGFDSAQS